MNAASGKLPVLIVVHQETSNPGRIGEELRHMGHELDIRRPCMGHDLPKDMSGHAGAVVFGGPMSANDDHMDFIRRELDWIPKAVASGKPYLGVCLGAQLLARAGGARVAPHKDGWHEIGYYPLRPTQAGQALFPDKLHVYQWHGEGFELPRGAQHLARGRYFPNQAMRVGDNAYGIQFHPEVTGAMMRIWTAKAAHRMSLPGAQARDLHLHGHAKYDAELGLWLRRFLKQHWLKEPAAINEPLAEAAD